MLQIPALVWPEGAFAERSYFSSFSDSWVQHAKAFVGDTVKRLGLSAGSFVVEVASNDGYLLQHAAAAGIPCLGIEPSVNAGIIARERGVPTVPEFLDETLARKVRGEYGPADLVVANNVYARIPDLRGFTRSLRTLLADDGWLSIEVHHALNLVRDTQFDTIDHEHFQYYTLLSATRALATAGLAVVDAELLSTHGGSLRIWARPARIAPPPSDRVLEVLRHEKAAGLHRAEGYLSCARAVRHCAKTFYGSCSSAALRVSGSSATGRSAPVRHCSTTAVSAAICSSTSWTAIRTSMAASRPACASRVRTKADRRRSSRCGLGVVAGSGDRIDRPTRLHRRVGRPTSLSALPAEPNSVGMQR